MTEDAVITPESVTDAQVDEFFSSGGEIKAEPEKEVPKAEPEKEIVKEEPREEKKVNLGALHEERSRRKQEAERATKAEARAAELERQLQERQQPADDEDPLESVRRDTQQVKEVLIAQANKALQEKETNEYWNNVRKDEAIFTKDAPDYTEAVNYLVETRRAELELLGFNEDGVKKILHDETKWISDKAYTDEVNPAERFYKLAKQRGYKPAETKEPVKNIEINTKLEKIKKGMETNKQLPTGSKSVNQDLTAESLADMKVDALSNLRGQTEFDKAWAKLFA